jgi:hypothetical protein
MVKIFENFKFNNSDGNGLQVVVTNKANKPVPMRSTR